MRTVEEWGARAWGVSPPRVRLWQGRAIRGVVVDDGIPDRQLVVPLEGFDGLAGRRGATGMRMLRSNAHCVANDWDTQRTLGVPNPLGASPLQVGMLGSRSLGG